MRYLLILAWAMVTDSGLQGAEPPDTSFPAAQQLQSVAKLGDFVVVYHVKEFTEPHPPDGPPRISYRDVFITHNGDTKSFIFRDEIPLPSKAELISSEYPIRQFCSQRTTWEYYNPKRKILYIMYKPDPWHVGRHWNPNGFSMQPVLLPFERLSWVNGSFGGVSLIEWRDWFDQKFTDSLFRKLVRGPIVKTDKGFNFGLALLESHRDENGGDMKITDNGIIGAYTVTRHPELDNIPVIDRIDDPAPTGQKTKGGGYTTFDYELRKRPGGSVPLLKHQSMYALEGELFRTVDLEFFEGIDASERIDLCIDPGLAEKVYDETYHMAIDP